MLPSYSAATGPYQVPSSPMAKAVLVIARSRKPTPVIRGSLNQAVNEKTNKEEDNTNEKHVYALCEGRKRSGSDRIYAPDGLHCPRFSRHFHQCRQQREQDLGQRQQPAVNRS